MSLNKGLAPNIPDDVTAGARVEPAVRPKVMRRPATFSGVQGQPSMPTIHLPPVAGYATDTENENLALSALPLVPSVSIPTKLWQDDLRFGVAMLTILVLVNLALIAWLPHLRKAEQATAQAPVEFVHTAPPVRAARPEPLTMYAKPTEDAPVQEEAPEDQTVVTAPAVHTLRSVADSGPDQ